MLAQTPPAIVQIAERTASQERAPIVFRLHRVFDVHAGPMHRHDDMLLAVASQDGNAIKVRVLHDLIGGKPADANAVAQVQNQYEHPNPGDVFHRPFDRRYIGEYAYTPVDARTYRFSSSVHDAAHGDGTFWLDAAGNVVKYQYTPYVLPKYTHSGTIVYQRAQVLPGVWAVTSETHEYSGRYAIFGGGATVAITCDTFSRYQNVASAVAALSALPGE
jgi:hypothetical protein